VPSLFVIRGTDQGSRFELEDALVGLGRDPSNVVQLHDTEVSRQHAQLRREGSDYRLVDLRSSNGSFVNGQRTDAHLMASGDHLQVGGTLMLYTGPSEEVEHDLAGKVDISSQTAVDERSHIIHSVAPAEGKKLFDLQTPLPQESWLALARTNFQAMYHAALAVSHTLDIDQLLQRIMDVIFDSLGPDRGCIMLLDQDTTKLVPKVRRTREKARPGDRPAGDQTADVRPSERPGDKITISKTILDYVMDRREGVLTTDAREDQRWNPAASIVQQGVREAICVPLQGRYGVVGVIYVDTSMSPQEVLQHGRTTKFTQDHLKLMVAIGHQAALAVEDTRYYSAMVQAERLAAIGQTIATVSHHVKNILQGIRGGSYLIEMGLSEHDETLLRKGWHIVEKNQGKISNLVMDMLTFSKEREPEPVPSEINHEVGDVIELMQSRAAEVDVQLTWSPAPEIPTLVFDPEGIHRAVLNVVTNAIDAAADSDQPGRVDVRTEYPADGSTVRIVIEDNGPGVAPQQRESLFSPFISTKKGRGTGLGLPVSEKIVKEHGGRILVDSTPGHGARFTLELPAVPVKPAPPSGTERHQVKEMMKEK
jgi:two-component system, NtrC family, sensor kinase